MSMPRCDPGCPCLCSPLPGLKASLQRLQLEYVDVVFANRPDNNTPMEGGWELHLGVFTCLSLA